MPPVRLTATKQKLAFSISVIMVLLTLPLSYQKCDQVHRNGHEKHEMALATDSDIKLDGATYQ